MNLLFFTGFVTGSIAVGFVWLIAWLLQGVEDEDVSGTDLPS